MLVARLMGMFHKWPNRAAVVEDALTYDNAKLAHALIVSGQATGQKAVFERGLQAPRWLVEVHTSERGSFPPRGSTGFYRGLERGPFPTSNRWRPMQWFRRAWRRIRPPRNPGV